MTDILAYTASDKEERKKLKAEQEAWRSIEALTGGLREKLSKKEQELEKKQRAEQKKLQMIRFMLSSDMTVE